MVSYHFPIHFMALNVTSKEIMIFLMNLSFLITTWDKTLINFSIMFQLLPKSNRNFDNIDIYLK